SPSSHNTSTPRSYAWQTTRRPTTSRTGTSDRTMGHIQKRGPNKYSARYTDLDGRQRLKSFRRKTDAQDFLNRLEADVLRGTYVARRAGGITLAAYAEGWQTRLTTDPASRVQVGIHLRVHILPTLGRYPLTAIKPGVVQGLIGELERKGLAPSY